MKKRPLKIAMSTLSAVGYGGVTYYMNLLPSIARADKYNQYIIFGREDFIKRLGINQENFTFVKCSESMSHSLLRFAWEQLVMPFKLSKLGVDLIFTSKNLNVFLARTKTIISIRNMEPLFYKKYKNHWKLNCISFLRYLLTKYSVKKADAIIAVSEHSKECLIDLFPNIKNKVFMAYNGNPLVSNRAR